MSKIIRKCVLKGQKEALGYAWCFPMTMILKRITILMYTFQSSMNSRSYTFFASSLFFASAKMGIDLTVFILILNKFLF